MSGRALALLLLIVIGAKPLAAAAAPEVALQIGMHIVRAEVAASPAARTRGLMFRESLAPNQGMLFIFDATEPASIWMRNTLLPLAVAFIDQRGVILNIEEMAPQSDDIHASKGPARYALEMIGGWFARRGVKPGDRVLGLPGASDR